MYRFLALVLLTPLAARAQGPDLYFAVEAVEVARQNVPALHSGAAAQHGGRWLFLAGRTNGIHGLIPGEDPFPPAAANAEAVVYDPATDQRWAAPLDGLPAAVREPLEALNVQYHQDGETLYVVGGYGYSAAAGGYVTFGTLTAVDVPGLIDAVIGGTALAPHLRQLADDRLRVTGGHLVRLGDRYYLAGGQRFDGAYLGAFEQEYTEAVRAFRIVDDGATLALADYAETADAARLHRRDGNVGPVVRPDGTPAFALYGGVFTPSSPPLPYRTPVTFDDAGLDEGAFEARFGHYTTALLPIYDAAHASMHTVFFGGMGQFWLDEADGVVKQDNLVPFIDDVAVLSVGADGAAGERLLDPLPGYLGTNSYVFLDPAAPVTEHGVIELDRLEGRTRVGFFVGGIAADTQHPGWMPVSGTSWASDRLFALYVTPLPTPAVEGGRPAGFAVALAGPNPFREATRLAVTIDAPDDLEVAVFDAVGRRVALLHAGPLAAGPHVFEVDGARLPSGVYVVRVTGTRGAAAERLVRLR
ncbi:MAG TPA: T9SS type A sorting domain-containing protein [Rubricoccaceae bacterium]|nr:T9SS type A sorting domain-containing protein [Rubricoccaceae bacterium]